MQNKALSKPRKLQQPLNSEQLSIQLKNIALETVGKKLSQKF